MPAAYGFKATDPKDALAISNLISQADSVQEQHYDTLAQYRINDVELKPHSLSLGFPRRWMLTMNTTLMGFNQKNNNQALYFRNDKELVGDGYVTYPLSAKQFSNMVRGGLYDNPQDYTKRLRTDLVNHQFYRKTKVSLTTARLLDSRLLISAGDLRTRKTKSREYMIGNDLNAYAAFGPDKNLQSNLDKVLDAEVINLVKHPVKKREKSLDRPIITQRQAMPELPNVEVSSEVDMKINKAQLDKLRSMAAVPNSQNSATPSVTSDAVSSAMNNDNQTPSSKARLASLNASENAQRDSLNNNNHDEVEVDTNLDQANDQNAKKSQVNDQQVASSLNSNHNGAQTQQSDATDDFNNTNNDDGNDNGFDLDDVMDQLGNDDAQTTQRRRRRQHAYVDDFGSALQNSQEAKQQKLTKQRNLQRQEAESTHTGPDL